MTTDPVSERESDETVGIDATSPVTNKEALYLLHSVMDMQLTLPPYPGEERALLRVMMLLLWMLADHADSLQADRDMRFGLSRDSMAAFLVLAHDAVDVGSGEPSYLEQVLAGEGIDSPAAVRQRLVDLCARLDDHIASLRWVIHPGKRKDWHIIRRTVISALVLMASQHNLQEGDGGPILFDASEMSALGASVKTALPLLCPPDERPDESDPLFDILRSQEKGPVD